MLKGLQKKSCKNIIILSAGHGYLQIFIHLTSQVDSNSFFLDHSYGANSEVAGIVTLLAVVDQLGRLKRSKEVSIPLTRDFPPLRLISSPWNIKKVHRE